MLKFTKDSFTRNLAQGRLLVPYLDRFAEYDEPFEFKYAPKVIDDAWHPSGDCLPPCAELYAHAIDPHREPHSPSLQRAFLVGHFWHQVLQRIIVEKLEFATPQSIERIGIREWGMPRFAECTMGCIGGHSEHCDAWRPLGPRPYHWAAGAGDIAPLVLPSGWEGICDIKTMSSNDWNSSFRSGLLPARFAEKYEAQINIYMEFFDQDHGMILGVNKDSPHGFIEFIFDRNQTLIDTILAKWEYLSDCVAAGEPPVDDADESFPMPFTGPSN